LGNGLCHIAVEVEFVLGEVGHVEFQRRGHHVDARAFLKFHHADVIAADVDADSSAASRHVRPFKLFSGQGLA